MDMADDKPSDRVTELIMPTDDQLESGRSDDNPSTNNVGDKSRDVICETAITESPILGRHFKLPDLSNAFDPDPPILDDSLSYIPVYTHLVTHDLVPIVRPKTPPIFNTLRFRKTLRSKNHYEIVQESRIHENEHQDEMRDYSPRRKTFDKNKKTSLQED